MLFHRLERERVVQQVDVVHQRRLLHPLTRDLVPPAEAVDHQRVARPRAEVERLVGDPLGAEVVRLAGVAYLRQPGDERLEDPGPVVLGAEQETD